MALDPAIPLQTQVPQIQGPLQLLSQQYALQQARQQIASGQQEQQLRAAQLAGLQRETAGAIKLGQDYSGALTTDANGVQTFDRGKLRDAVLADPLTASQWPTISASLDKADQATLALQQTRTATATAQANALGWLAKGVKAAGDTPQAFTLAVQHAIANGTVSAEDAKPYLDAVAQNPQGVAALTDHLISASPDVSKASETERHNRALEEQAKASEANTATRLAEEARHDRISEGIQQFNARANNPFAGMFGGVPGPTTAGAPAAPGQGPVVTPPSAAPGGPTATGGNAPTIGTAAPAPGSVKAGEPLPSWKDASGLHGSAYLASLNPGIASQVKAYAEGRMPFPSGYALKSGYFQGLLQMVGQYDPSFDAANYNARNKARSDYQSPSGTAGKQITALNTIAGHLADLSQAADALKNGNFSLYNSVANKLATLTGWTGKTDFDTIAPKVADEIERVWRGAGGSTEDIDRTLGSLNSSMAPAQLHSAIAKTVDLIKSRAETLKDQRNSVLGPYGADIPILSPKTKATFERLEGGNAPNAPQSVPDGRVRVIGPNGQTGTVPKGAPLPAGWKVGP